MSVSPSTTKTRVLAAAGLAATLLVAAGVTVWAGPGSSTSPASKAVAEGERAGGEVAAAAPDATATEPSTTVAPPTAPAPSTTAAPATSVPRSTSRATTPTTAAKATPAAPTTTAPAAAPVTPKFAPGQRINPTSAQVQAAISTLHQRIPLFEPTEPQLRTFADAACTSFDQGQSFAQVQNTVRQAVTYIQGASLTQADAEFAVRTVVQLRCPGYLP